MMDIFKPHLEELQSTILNSEYDSTVSSQCSCGKNKHLFHCEDCFSSSSLCQGCIVTTHQTHPFHNIQAWQDNHFMWTSLHELSATLQLGHSGFPCPNRQSGLQGHLTTIVHINRIYQICVEYCFCGWPVAEPHQLVHVHLFPATIAKPATAFTFILLNDYHAHSLSSKKSAYDYFDTLQKVTNAAFLQDVLVCFQDATFHILKISFLESICGIQLCHSCVVPSSPDWASTPNWWYCDT